MLNRFLKIKSNTKKVTPTIITYIILILLDIITLQKYIKKYANAYEYANTKQKTPRFNMQHLKKKKTFTKKLFFKFLKNLNHRKNILKITKINWQTTKKKLTKIHVPNMQTKDYSLKTKTLFNLSAHSKINKTNVNFFKKYRLKKRFNLDTIKKRYQYWLKRNEYQRIFFKQKITPQYARKVIQLHKLVRFLFMSNQKKKTIKIVKKLNKLRTYVKIAHIRLPNYANITTYKSILQNTRTDMFKIYKRRNFSQKINYVWSNYKLNKPVYVCTYVDTIKYQITIPTKFTKKTKPIEVIILKKTLHKQIFKNFFLLSSNQLYNNIFTPTFNLLYTPSMSLKSFNMSKYNKVLFKNINNILLKSTILNNLNTKNSIIIKSNVLSNNDKNTTTNYYPIFFFTFIKSKNTESIYNYNNIKINLYYNNIVTKLTAKYKMFFTFYVINFLEKFLFKKLWIRINTQDQINPLYKNYLLYFFKKNEFLYKKFYKLISVKELLEILWLMLQTHDLQIFLAFIKKKFESSHFKKHKKILSILFDVFKKNKLIFKLLKIKGFYFDIRGKIGVSGNAKKRHHFFSIGKITTTSQNTKSYLQQNVVWTPTGQMGITCMLQY